MQLSKNSLLVFLLLLLFSLISFAVNPSVFVTFYIDDQELGEVAVNIDERKTENSQIDFASFKEAVGNFLTEEKYTELQKLLIQDKFKFIDLNKIGLKSAFDLNQLSAKIDVPPEMRTLQRLSFQIKSRENIQAAELTPAFASASINILATKPFMKNQQEQYPLNGTLDSSLKISDIVIEDQHEYTEYDLYKFKRMQSRVVYDHLPSLIRYQLGDLKYISQGYQSFIQMGGLSITKDFTLTPYSSTSAQSSSSFILATDSQVNIIINSQKYRTLQLKAGRYELSDLPIGFGYNNIDLQITDAFGKTETLNFPYISNNDLLPVDTIKYSHNIGVTAINGLSSLEYQQDKWVYSGYLKKGFTNLWTASLYGQSAPQQKLIGIENYLGYKHGIISLDVAGTEIDKSYSDLAAKTKFRSWPSQENTLREWGLSLEYIGERFAPIGQLSPLNTTLGNAEVFAGLQAWKNISTTVGLIQKITRGNSTNEYTEYIRLRQAFSETSQLNIDYSSMHGGLSGDEWLLNINFNWTSFEGKISQNVNYETKDKTKHYDFQYSEKKNTAFLSFDKNELSENGAVKFFKNSNRYNLSLDYSAQRPLGSPVNESGNINLSTALLWTSNGGITISSPVYDSFAIFELNNELINSNIEINRSGEDSEYASDGWNTLVIPSLDSYRVRSVLLESSSDDAVEELSIPEIRLKPAYKSGLYTLVGVLSDFIARGQLIDEYNKPIALTAFDIIKYGDTNSESLTFFTNRDGQFELEKIPTGTYLLKVDSYKQIEFSIPENSKNIYNLNTMKLEKNKRD